MLKLNKKNRFLVIAMTAILCFAGCSKDKNNNPNNPMDELQDSDVFFQVGNEWEYKTDISGTNSLEVLSVEDGIFNVERVRMIFTTVISKDTIRLFDNDSIWGTYRGDIACTLVFKNAFVGQTWTTPLGEFQYILINNKGGYTEVTNTVTTIDTTISTTLGEFNCIGIRRVWWTKHFYPGTTFTFDKWNCIEDYFCKDNRIIIKSKQLERGNGYNNPPLYTNQTDVLKSKNF